MVERLGAWMRWLGRELIRGAVLIGASLTCGGEMASILRASGAAPAQPERLSEMEVRREAAAGTRAIERYLAAHDHLQP